MPINLPSSKPQANVASYLEQFRKIYLQQALSNAIQSVDLRIINRELDQLASARELRKLASRGVRGEFVFAVPSLLATKPNLLGFLQGVCGGLGGQVSGLKEITPTATGRTGAGRSGPPRW